MSSDSDYMAFLNKANQDTGASNVKTQSTRHATVKLVNTDVPGSLVDVEQVLTSETEEPFKPLALKWEKDGLPTEEEFSDLVHHPCTRISTEEFDPQSQYTAVIDAVKAAGSGEATVYQSEQKGTRIQYFIVSVDTRGQKLVGLHALAVET